MAVYQDKKRGTWYARISYSIDGIPYSKTKRGFRYKKDAIAYEHEFRKNLKPYNSLTFNELFNLYQKSRQVKRSTLENSRRLYEVFYSGLKNKNIERIRPINIQNALNDIYNSEYSKSYKNDGINSLKSVLKFSNNFFNTKFNLALIKTIPIDSSDIVIPSVWTDTEFDLFIEKIDNPVYQAYFLLLYKTGMRKGEAIALQYEDLDDNKLTINKSLRTFKEGIKSTKTLSSIRTILLDDNTLETLRNVAQSPFIFGGEFPLSTSNIDRAFNKGIELSKVPKIRIHDLRHSHATNLINAGANIVAVSKRLGHTDISMTLKVYTHLLEKTEKELLDYL